MRAEEERIITDVNEHLKWIFKAMDEVFSENVKVDVINSGITPSEEGSLINISDDYDSWFIYDTDLKHFQSKGLKGISVEDAMEAVPFLSKDQRRAKND